MDAHELDYEDESLDLIIGVGMLHHLSLTEVYSEINRGLNLAGLHLERTIRYKSLTNSS